MCRVTLCCVCIMVDETIGSMWGPPGVLPELVECVSSPAHFESLSQPWNSMKCSQSLPQICAGMHQAGHASQEGQCDSVWPQTSLPGLYQVQPHLRP